MLLTQGKTHKQTGIKTEEKKVAKGAKHSQMQVSVTLVNKQTGDETPSMSIHTPAHYWVLTYTHKKKARNVAASF